ncbi:hypothetical protein O6H91_02G075700 [Diphasiastrum complanatum]|uniref:Uncharacterized protein n=1 Tax=Diphasiastrum complanatum TaxID=34168 RepID=A0ACC2EGV9_DIPCM|nr:hypothetical protein O6H91_02G075700 [Diphasiastrum complanatum]
MFCCRSSNEQLFLLLLSSLAWSRNPELCLPVTLFLLRTITLILIHVFHSVQELPSLAPSSWRGTGSLEALEESRDCNNLLKITSRALLKKDPWTGAEDAILVAYVEKHGKGNWNSLQKHSGLSRCGRSCHLRWANHLRPNLKKGAFTASSFSYMTNGLGWLPSCQEEQTMKLKTIRTLALSEDSASGCLSTHVRCKACICPLLMFIRKVI